MRFAFAAKIVILAVALLASCGPVTLYHRPGVAVAEAERAETRCAVQALRDAPVANQVFRDPPVYVPARKICDRSGACVVRGGFWRPGEVYTVDANAKLRRKITDLCMADLGYRRVSVPLCTASTAQGATGTVTTILPPLSDTSCAIRNRDGSFQIVDSAQ